MIRRQFLKHALRGTAAAMLGGAVYGCVEATWCRVARNTIRMPGLPDAFRGLRVAFLTDMHHGPWTSLAYIRAAVRKTNELKPDVILLGGDYCHNGKEFIEPCIDALGALVAPHGVFGVLGNHDYYHSVDMTREALDKNSIRLLLNEGEWIERGGQRLRIAGLDDYWLGGPNPAPAVDGMHADERCVMLCHNPDFVEKVKDKRVGLMLSGHTHGGQVVFPIVGAPIVPSWYGQKYLQGLVSAPNNLLFISRGLGTITPPVRFACRPEINLIELV